MNRGEKETGHCGNPALDGASQGAQGRGPPGSSLSRYLARLARISRRERSRSHPNSIHTSDNHESGGRHRPPGLRARHPGLRGGPCGLDQRSGDRRRVDVRLHLRHSGPALSQHRAGRPSIGDALGIPRHLLRLDGDALRAGTGTGTAARAQRRAVEHLRDERLLQQCRAVGHAADSGKPGGPRRASRSSSSFRRTQRSCFS